MLWIKNEISAFEFEKLLATNAVIQAVDIRELSEWERVRVRGTVHIPLSEFFDRMNEVDFTKPVYLFCRSGVRSANLCNTLAESGLETINVTDGIRPLYEKNSPVLIEGAGFNPIYFT